MSFADPARGTMSITVNKPTLGVEGRHFQGRPSPNPKAARKLL